MAGMEGLGRQFDLIPIAAGQAMKFRGASAIGFLCTGADTFTIRVGSVFGTVATSPGSIINHYYQRADTNGTHAWTKQTQSAADNVVQGTAGYTTYFEVLTSMISDPYDYIKVSAGGSGLVCAVLHDLVAQRKAANLEILGA
jgi:hypothetical protein